MLGLEELSEPLQDEIQHLKAEIKKLRHQNVESKIKGIKEARESHAKLVNLLKSFKDRIDLDDDPEEIEKYKSQARQFQGSLNQILEQLDYYQAEGRTQKQLFKEVGGDTDDLDNADLQRLIQIGRKYQSQGIDALIRAQRYLQEGIEITDNVNLTLDQQIQQLDRIYNTVKDTDSKMDRAMKYINYFAKQVYTDKCLLVMIGLIITAIIVVVILTAVGVGGNSGVAPDQLT